ncbi:MAG: DUF3868 domain-containing protein [Muribaculaceae bacterium]|nr:DUF3868 domain-containing protein [Muribaculaceae bacterium]
MKLKGYIFLSYLISMSSIVMASSVSDGLKICSTSAKRSGDTVRITADINLDGLRLGRNQQLYITPVIESDNGDKIVMPSALVNGHAMHIAYERKSLPRRGGVNHNVLCETKRQNRKSQTLYYVAETVLQPWMLSGSTGIHWVVDSCGCGVPAGTMTGETTLLGLNPAKGMRVAYVTPAVTDLPVSVHEGKAQVQFEVSKSDLHISPYLCRSGQRIDNRQELKIIDDSISYALSDKNVEIAKIRICGYASPEGSYLSNERLSTDRSRALSEYIANRYNLPSECVEYAAVAENWDGLRDLIESSGDKLTDRQRSELIALIDRPAYGPSDYDAKDLELRTDSRFSELYKILILPVWYPQLRATAFEISTRLKPLSDEQLAEVISISPEKMSLNQMFRVAGLYAEGTDDFNRVIETALRYYPDDETANLNAAAAAIKSGEFDKAEKFIDKAGESAEAYNARGILAANKGDIRTAVEMFQKALPLPEAAKNIELLGE